MQAYEEAAAAEAAAANASAIAAATAPPPMQQQFPVQETMSVALASASSAVSTDRKALVLRMSETAKEVRRSLGASPPHFVRPQMAPEDAEVRRFLTTLLEEAPG